MKLKTNTQVASYCPDCSPRVKLIVKTNRLNGNQFLGCPNWPACNYTREIPEDIAMRAMGQRGLFDK